MYASRFFCDRYFAPRYWPKVGSDAAADPRTQAFAYDPSARSGAFAWDAAGTAQSFAWDAAGTSRPYAWGPDMATDVSFEVVTSGEAVSYVGTPTAATDVTSWTLRWRIYDRQGGTLLLTPTVTKTTPGTGVVTVSLTAAQTASLRSSAGRTNLWFDFWRTDSGSERELARGQLPVRA